MKIENGEMVLNDFGKTANDEWAKLPERFPNIQPYLLDEQHILILWCPAGDFRPYSATSTLSEKAQRQYYIRSGSSAVAAKGDSLRRLFEFAARTPFDDRIHQQATIDYFDLALIQAYLHEVKSDFLKELDLTEGRDTGFPKMYRKMENNGWIEMEFPDKKTRSNQRYRITTSGKRLLRIIKIIDI
jgi:predicted HTH transcriptional regulator